MVVAFDFFPLRRDHLPMSKSNSTSAGAIGLTTPYAPPKPPLPCPTSPLQQTESESYEYERQSRHDPFSQYNHYTNDTITDRSPYTPEK